MANRFACEIIDLLGGTAKVARLVGVKPPSVSAWRNDGIPKDKLIILTPLIESVSGGKHTRKTLLPNDWHRIWPELAKAGEAA